MAENRSSRGTGIVWLLAMIASLSFAFAYAVQPVRNDSYKFLEGQPLIASGAMFPMDCMLGANDSEYNLSEYRAYSWGGDYKTVKATVGRELEDLGFRKDLDKGDYCSWSKSGHVSIFLRNGRSYTRDQALAGKKADPGVTVTCDSEIPYNWVNRFRAWIEPSI